MMLNCFNATRLMSESHERPLLTREKAALMIHTAMCRACRNFDRQLSVLSDMSHQYVKHAAPDESEMEQEDPI